MNTVRDKSIETSLPALFRSLAGDVLNSFTEQIAGDRSGNEFPDILTFEEWTEELTRGLGRSMVERFIEVRSQQAKEMEMKCAKCGYPSPPTRIKPILL